MTNDDSKTKAELLEEIRALRAQVEGLQALASADDDIQQKLAVADRWRAQLHVALEAGRAGAFAGDLETNHLEWSPELEALFGMESGSFGGRMEDFEACVAPEDLAAVRADVQRSRYEQDHVSSPFRIRRRDTGELRWLQARGRILRDAAGKRRIVGVILDISDLKRYEIELEHVQRLYAALSEINQAVVRLETRADLFRVVCRALVELGGFSLAWIGRVGTSSDCDVAIESFHSANGNDGVDAIPRDGLTLARRAIEHARSGEPHVPDSVSTIHEIVSATAAMAAHPILDAGRVAWVLGVSATDPDFFGDRERALLREAALDISFALEVFAGAAERAGALEALRASEERLSRALANTSAGLWEWRLESDSLLLDDYWLDMFGYAKSDLEPLSDMTWTEYCHSDDLQKIRRILRECLRGERAAFECECRFRHRDGTWCWILSRGRFDQWTPDRRPLRMVGTYIDITERMRVEEGLAHAHDLMQYVIAHARNATAVLDRDLRYVYVSEHFVQDYKLPDADIIGKHHYEVFPDIPRRWRDVHRRVLAGEILCEDEDPFPRADGTVEWIRWECRPWYSSDGAIGGIILSTEVITDRKRAEDERNALWEQLVQSQKMESIGRLAGGVAHDFNNMLAVILGNTELAMDAAGGNAALGEYLGEIQHAAERSAELTRQLLAFARRQTLAPKELDLNDTVAGMLSMLRRLIGENIELAWLPGHGLWPVRLDPGQVSQILANLIVNARDAIAGAGNVTIETKNVTLDADDCGSSSDCVPGDYVMVAISDTGTGMAPETRRHLFEPFFTTKSVGQGTGLGLATVYGNVKQIGGMIDVQSEVSEGTTFRIYFPRHRGGVAADAGRRPSEPVQGGQETVLLVEDEPAMLRIAESMLQRLGYRVVAAGSPGEALEIADAYGGHIDLLMTDVVMPQMNGRELGMRLHETRPTMKLLFMSGYTADAIANHGILEEGLHFIQKPFALSGLATKLRTVMEAS